MTINQLIPGELAVVRALQDQRPRNSVQIAEITDLPTWAVRSMAKELVRRGLLKRSWDREHIGSWEITEHGISHLAAVSQLRLVR